MLYYAGTNKKIDEGVITTLSLELPENKEAVI
jgi:hypothetical protein